MIWLLGIIAVGAGGVLLWWCGWTEGYKAGARNVADISFVDGFLRGADEATHHAVEWLKVRNS